MVLKICIVLSRCRKHTDICLTFTSDERKKGDSRGNIFLFPSQSSTESCSVLTFQSNSFQGCVFQLENSNSKCFDSFPFFRLTRRDFSRLIRLITASNVSTARPCRLHCQSYMLAPQKHSFSFSGLAPLAFFNNQRLSFFTSFFSANLAKDQLLP